MGVSAWRGAADDEASHGLCEDCTGQLLESLKAPSRPAPGRLLSTLPIRHRHSA